MAEKYWTYCMYCGGMICGVEVLEDYPDVVVLSAHKTCHERTPMDPDMAWQLIRETLKDLHKHPDNAAIRENAINALTVLVRWLRMGGFPPKLESLNL
jgi:hypothetical protein